MGDIAGGNEREPQDAKAAVVTDHHAGFIVTLRQELAAPDAKQVADAIRLLRHVATVTPLVADVDSRMATEQAKFELREQLREVLR